MLSVNEELQIVGKGATVTYLEHLTGTTRRGDMIFVCVFVPMKIPIRNIMCVGQDLNPGRKSTKHGTAVFGICS